MRVQYTDGDIPEQNRAMEIAHKRLKDLEDSDCGSPDQIDYLRDILEGLRQLIRGRIYIESLHAIQRFESPFRKLVLLAIAIVKYIYVRLQLLVHRIGYLFAGTTNIVEFRTG